jgi:hypothetical protein
VIDWPYWTVILPVFLALAVTWLGGYLGRLANALRRRPKDRIVIRGRNAALPTEYLEHAILSVAYDFERQRTLAAQIDANSGASTRPTPRAIGPAHQMSVQSLAPVSLAQGWASTLWNLRRTVYNHARADFRVDIVSVTAEKQLALNVLLRSRGAVRDYWRRTVPGAVRDYWRRTVPVEKLTEEIADIAYNLVVVIWRSRATRS